MTRAIRLHSLSFVSLTLACQQDQAADAASEAPPSEKAIPALPAQQVGPTSGGSAGGPADSLMVLVPGGSFTMGCTPGAGECYDNEKPAHTVRVSGFWMGATEVTQGQYQALMGSNPSQAKYRGVSLLGVDLPVQNVSWLDAVRYTNARSKQEGLAPCYQVSGEDVAWPEGLGCEGYRLPTEAEWEYAGRAGSSLVYAGTSEPGAVCSYGNVGDSTAKRFDWNRELFSCSDGVAGLAPVGSYTPNAWGLYDMTGNVWEWTWDRYQSDYPSGSSVDPVGPQSGAFRVLRGGSWDNYPRNARLTYRNGDSPDYRNYELGLRVSRSVETRSGETRSGETRSGETRSGETETSLDD